MTAEQKAEQLIDTFKDVNLAIACCNEVLGYMGADRGTIFWTEVLNILKNK